MSSMLSSWNWLMLVSSVVMITVLTLIPPASKSTRILLPIPTLSVSKCRQEAAQWRRTLLWRLMCQLFNICELGNTLSKRLRLGISHSASGTAACNGSCGWLARIARHKAAGIRGVSPFDLALCGRSLVLFFRFTYHPWVIGDEHPRSDRDQGSALISSSPSGGGV